MKTSNKRLTSIFIFATILLVIPIIAMQFSNEVNWTISDFMVAGTLLFSTGLLFEFVLRKVKKMRNRIILVSIIIALLLLTWIELAVGIFGSPLAGS